MWKQGPGTGRQNSDGLSQVRHRGDQGRADDHKLDFEGFLSPLAIEAYAEYMHRHRKMPDGSLREADNWQKGIPLASYMKSLWRHFFAVWKGYRNGGIDINDACGVMFNIMG